ncbi:MAG: hypothetical protein GMKNLPBB_03352 [Myxococcota bacterium]|nr:hypothetical protein [Myxococcota bacterium]
MNVTATHSLIYATGPRELRKLGRYAALSLLAHGAAAALVVFFSGLEFETTPPPPQTIIPIQIARFGPKRPPGALERIATAPQPSDKAAIPAPPDKARTDIKATAPEKDDRVALDNADNKPKAEKTPPAAAAMDLKAAKSLFDTGVKELKEKAEREGRSMMAYGDPDGFLDGDSDVNSPGSRYMKDVGELISRLFNPPSFISPVELLRLETLARITINADGKVTSMDLRKPSGNGHFDSACLNAIKQASPLPPPDKALVKYLAQGVTVSCTKR